MFNNICQRCGNPVNRERLDALKELNINYILCKNCAEKKIKPSKGIYEGEIGTSNLIIANKVDLQSGIYLERLMENQENNLTPEEE